LSADTFRRLAALGLTTDQIAGVLDLLDEVTSAATKKEEDRKAGARERWHRWSDKRKANVSQHEQTLANNSHAGDARGEDNLLTKKISGQEENKKAAPKALSDLAAFKSDLEQDATAEQVEAFAKHRKSKNGQNSAYAAKLFRRDAEACRLSVSDAIDTAISRGWLTVKPEYLAGRKGAPQLATAPPPDRDFNSILDAIQGKTNVSQHPGPTIDGSVERTDRRGVAGVVQFDALSSRR
jgi:hypothetical protein